MYDIIDKNLESQLILSAKVRSLELLRADIKNYALLLNELEKCEDEYMKGMIPYIEKIDQANEELTKVKSPGYSDGLGGYVETLDIKLSRIEKQKTDAAQEIRTYVSKYNSEYVNKKWLLLSRIAVVRTALESMEKDDREFINDLYIYPIGFKKVMEKYQIEYSGDVYRKATNILKKVL